MLKILLIPNIQHGETSQNPRNNHRFHEVVECVRKHVSKEIVTIITCNPPLIPLPFFTDNIDVVICNKITSEIEGMKKPIIVCDRFDSTPTSSYRSYLNNDLVIGYFKEYTFREKEKHSRLSLYHRYHFNILNEMYRIVPEKDMKRYDRESGIPDNKLDLIKCVTCNLCQYSNIMHHFMDMLAKSIILYDEKPIDVFMVCHLHEKQPILMTHRKAGLEMLEQYKNKYNIVCQTGKLDANEYMDKLKQSKVCIAPYGLGERIALDQYGILAGCIVIKPPMDHLICDPNIYEKEQDMIETCSVDFSDLESILNRVLGEYDTKYNVIAANRRKKLMEYDQTYYANQFINAIVDTLCDYKPDKYSSYKSHRE